MPLFGMYAVATSSHTRHVECQDRGGSVGIEIEIPDEVTTVDLVPWMANCYGIANLNDMQRFPAEEFCSALAIMERVRCDALTYRSGDAACHLGKLTLPSHKREEMEATLRAVERNIRAASLSTSGEALMELRTALINWRHASFSDMSGSDVAARIDEVQRTLHRELKSMLFMYIPPDRAQLYLNPFDGWEKVAERFKGTIADIEECSRCLACDRFGAAVFHVMLVAEVGAIEIGKLIQIQDPKPGWPSTIREMNRIVLRVKYQDLKPVEQTHRQFLGQLLPIMESMEQGWRHKISHIDNKLVLVNGEFAPEVASEIVIATRAFMRRLAVEMP
jgi:hypothetical protein